MNCIGHIFDEVPREEFVIEYADRQVLLGYSGPPLGSRLIAQKSGGMIALDAFGFEWVVRRNSGSSLGWLPTGAVAYVPSIEHERNAVMRHG